jgi:hypothetical protein
LQDERDKRDGLPAAGLQFAKIYKIASLKIPHLDPDADGRIPLSGHFGAFGWAVRSARGFFVRLHRPI